MLIGVCGTNFCTFVADNRKVSYNNGIMTVENDCTQKIFKLNDNVLFGAAGIFLEPENVLTPTEALPDVRQASLEYTLRATTTVLDLWIKDIRLPHRVYLIGGKDAAGKFCIFEVSVDQAKNKVVVNRRMPRPPISNFGISCCLPESLNDQKTKYLDDISRCITASREHKKCVAGLEKIIVTASNDDPAIGRNATHLSVF